MTVPLTLRVLRPDDSTVFASWQTDALFAAHAGWRLTSSPTDGEQWWRESIVAPDPLLLRLAAVEGEEPVGYVDLYGSGPDEREARLPHRPFLRLGPRKGDLGRESSCRVRVRAPWPQPVVGRSRGGESSLGPCPGEGGSGPDGTWRSRAVPRETVPLRAFRDHAIGLARHLVSAAPCSRPEAIISREVPVRVVLGAAMPHVSWGRSCMGCWQRGRGPDCWALWDEMVSLRARPGRSSIGARPRRSRATGPRSC